jgi:hypothetical protein
MQEADVIRFWTDDGDCWGFLFHHLTATHYSARNQRLLIDWALGTLVVAGPKVLDFIFMTISALTARPYSRLMRKTYSR